MVHTTDITQATNQLGFDIRNFIDAITPTEHKGRYICPVCNGNNFTINEETGAYQCWSGCDVRDIREAVSPWEDAFGGRSHDAPVVKKPTVKDKKPDSVPIPKDSDLLRLVDDDLICFPAPQATKPRIISRSIRENMKGCDIKTLTETVYKYNGDREVIRYEWVDNNHVKGRNKTFRQTHINGCGEVVWSKGSQPWMGYRQDEITLIAKTAETSPVILWVEGEKSVELARSVKLAAISVQGSAWKDGDLKPIFNQLKTDLGTVLQLFLTDNDEPGRKKAESFEKACNNAGLPCLIVNTSDICSDIPVGGDIEQLLQNMTGDELLDKLREQIENAIIDQIESEAQAEVKEDIPDSYEPDVTFTQKALNFLYGDRRWICVRDKLFVWEGNYYRYSPDAVERPRIASYCNNYVVPKEDKDGNITPTFPYAKPAKAREILDWAKMRFEINPELVNPPGINCKNGVVEVSFHNNGIVYELVPHDPQRHYYVTEPLVKYNPEANPHHKNRLMECLDKAQREVLMRNIAASINLPEVSKRRGRTTKILLACGLGANGKDSIRQVVSIIYGKVGMTSCSLADFQAYDDGRKFALAPLLNSRVNWASENPQTARLDRLQSLKIFATQNVLHAEWKGQDHIDFNPEAIGIFNLNEPPSLQGVLDAITSRIAVISFNKTYKSNPDPSNPNELLADPRFSYDQDFIADEVAPAFLNEMLESLSLLIKEGIDYECTQEAFRAVQRENNHLVIFCEDTGLTENADSYLSASDIWEKLEAWYKDNGTLEINGDGKKIWSDQVRPSDKNVKAVNQVLPRIKQLFPKAKLATMPHPSGKKNIPILKGICFNSSVQASANDNINIVINSTSVPNFHPNSTPIPPQSPPQETFINQGFHPTHPNNAYEQRKNKNKSECDRTCNENLKVEQNQPKLGWVGCDADIVSDTGKTTGVQLGCDWGGESEYTPNACTTKYHDKVSCDTSTLSTKLRENMTVYPTVGKHQGRPCRISAIGKDVVWAYPLSGQLGVPASQYEASQLSLTAPQVNESDGDREEYDYYQPLIDWNSDEYLEALDD